MTERDIELFRAFLEENTLRARGVCCGWWELYRLWHYWLKTNAKTSFTVRSKSLFEFERLLLEVGLRVGRPTRKLSSHVIRGLWLKPSALDILSNLGMDKL